MVNYIKKNYTCPQAYSTVDTKETSITMFYGSIQCTNQNRNLHISKILFLLPVSFTVEHKVRIAEFYLYMGFAADLLKNVVNRA